MLAVSSTTVQILVGIVATLGAGVILAISRALMLLYRNRQIEQRIQKTGLQKMSEFFFDQPDDPTTGTPGPKGWTTKVDATLKTLASGQTKLERTTYEILRELKDDDNGDHNLRGLVKRTAEAAGAEITAQSDERERVQRRDARSDQDQ